MANYTAKCQQPFVDCQLPSQLVSDKSQMCLPTWQQLACFVLLESSPSSLLAPCCCFPASSLRPLLPSLFSWWALCAKSHVPPLCWVPPWASWVWAWPTCWQARPQSTHARWLSPSHTRCSQGFGRCQTLLTWRWMLSWVPASSR